MGSRMGAEGAVPVAAAETSLLWKEEEKELVESRSRALPQSPVGGCPAAAQSAEREGVLMLATEPSWATQFTVAGVAGGAEEAEEEASERGAREALRFWGRALPGWASSSRCVEPESVRDREGAPGEESAAVQREESASMAPGQASTEGEAQASC